MEQTHLIIWSAMLGGLMTLATVAAADAAINRSLASLRGLVFVVLVGSSCILATGLHQIFFPGLGTVTTLMLKFSLGPLTGAVALTYLGMWLGIAKEDRLVNGIVVGGSIVLAIGTVLMVALTVTYGEDASDWLAKTATAFNMTGALLGTIAAMRAVLLGDLLARGIVVASLFLMVTVGGLFFYALNPQALGPWALSFIAFSTVAFFLVGIAMGLRRNQTNRRLARLESLALGADPATGLPRGSVLLTKVDDAFWRSARLNRECTVICLHLRNLYELGEVAGHASDQQILAAIGARMRRAVGFRNVIGMYHPRCFVIVISAARNQHLAAKALERLRYLLVKPLGITGLNDAIHTFVPRFGIGTVTVDANNADPTAVIDQAERLALGAPEDAVASPR